MELLDEIREDGHADTKFVRGAYGAGKSHFLSVVQDNARAAGWVTAHIECKVDGVQIDRFETLYPQIVSKLAFPTGANGFQRDGYSFENPMRALLERWTRQQINAVGIRAETIARPFDADIRLYSHLERNLFRTICRPILFVRFVGLLAPMRREIWKQPAQSETGSEG
jgi:hypothetical protein